MYLHRGKPRLNTCSDTLTYMYIYTVQIYQLFSSLLQHKYVSIAEVQIKREEELQQCPLTLVSNVTITSLYYI